MTNPYFSVVLPIYNEEKTISELYSRLIMTIEGLNKSFELIFVDDGSTDRSYKILTDLHLRDERVVVIKFSRNFGHHIAISAGLDYCSGEVVIIMDTDLQDNPEDIKLFYEKYKEGYDVVYGYSKDRGETLFRKMASHLFYRIFSVICNLDIPKEAGTFRILSKKVVVNLRTLKEKSRFMNGLIDWLGFSVAKIEVNRNSRHSGVSSYTLWKLTKLTLDAITSFSYFPLRIASYLGFFISSLSFIYGSYLVIRKLCCGIGMVGWSSLMVGILFFGGVQLIILGIIGEYIARIFTEVQNRHLYVVDEILKRG